MITRKIFPQHVYYKINLLNIAVLSLYHEAAQHVGWTSISAADTCQQPLQQHRNTLLLHTVPFFFSAALGFALITGARKIHDPFNSNVYS